MERSIIYFLTGWFVLLSILLITSCELGGDKENFVKVAPPVIENVSINLTTAEDSLVVFTTTQFAYSIDLGTTGDLIDVIIYVDDKVIDRKSGTNAQYGIFIIDPAKYNDGFHSLRIEFTASSGSKSLADLYGLERAYVWRDFVLETDTNPPDKPTGLSVTEVDGNLRLDWSKYTERNFEAYHVEAVYEYSSGKSKSWNYQSEHLDSTYFIDTLFFNGTITYSVSIQAAGRKSDTASITYIHYYEPELQVSYRENDDDLMISWKKPSKFTAKIDAYQLRVEYTLPISNEKETFDYSISGIDSLLLIDSLFFNGKATYKLSLQSSDMESDPNQVIFEDNTAPQITVTYVQTGDKLQLSWVKPSKFIKNLEGYQIDAYYEPSKISSDTRNYIVDSPNSTVYDDTIFFNGSVKYMLKVIKSGVSTGEAVTTYEYKYQTPFTILYRPDHDDLRILWDKPVRFKRSIRAYNVTVDYSYDSNNPVTIEYSINDLNKAVYIDSSFLAGNVRYCVKVSNGTFESDPSYSGYQYSYANLPRIKIQWDSGTNQYRLSWNKPNKFLKAFGKYEVYYTVFSESEQSHLTFESENINDTVHYFQLDHFRLGTTVVISMGVGTTISPVTRISSNEIVQYGPVCSEFSRYQALYNPVLGSYYFIDGYNLRSYESLNSDYSATRGSVHYFDISPSGDYAYLAEYGFIYPFNTTSLLGSVNGTPLIGATDMRVSNSGIVFDGKYLRGKVAKKPLSIPEDNYILEFSTDNVILEDSRLRMETTDPDPDAEPFPVIGTFSGIINGVFDDNDPDVLYALYDDRLDIISVSTQTVTESLSLNGTVSARNFSFDPVSKYLGITLQDSETYLLVNTEQLSEQKSLDIFSSSNFQYLILNGNVVCNKGVYIPIDKIP